ncbi:MAG: hypothetical protein A2X49_09550 [Lentisphaerae bacterium GWF2_52_8]|nr:MAG: hypothetical protein A2X49_09550 [Lentisphaerae bacterium GWF2_52_8]
MGSSLQKIAKSMNISVSTVSRALSGKAGVSSAMRSKIVALAQEQGFVPDPIASSLKSGKGYGLALITALSRTEISSYREVALMNLGKAAFGSVRVFNTGAGDELLGAVQEALAGKCQAIIVCGVSQELPPQVLETLAKRKVPLTVVDSHCAGFDRLLIDRAKGVCQATRMLLLSGCKNPLFFSSTGPEAPDGRLTGIMRGFNSVGKEFSGRYLARFAHTNLPPMKHGYELTRQILKTAYTDGIFCYSDTLAIGAMKAVLDAGVKIPQEIKLIGFDNLPVTEYLPVSLTTVAQPVDSLAETAIRKTLARLDDFDAAYTEESFPTTLLLRESAPVHEHSLRAAIFAEE